MGFFKGIDAANNTIRNPKLELGRYTLEVSRLFLKDTREMGTAFFADFKVLTSTNPEVEVGSTRTWMVSLQRKDIALGNLKGFALALSGVDTSDESAVKQAASEIEGFMEAAVAETNPTKGSTVGAEVVERISKEKRPYKAVNFYPVNQ